MKYSDLVKNGATDTEKQEFLVGGDTAAITIRIPENLRDVGKKTANCRSFVTVRERRTARVRETAKSRETWRTSP
ncbi:hypothetical protein [Parascardovia denticolens]|uniref:hypothetical protein n=1 Tax=Parascardovia denticolens TaxID=78258 RepID=UPI00055F9585|nr:hypothetical protein [Parascardovia denticolens]